MPASWNVANNAMDAPTGPDGVRPCDCSAAGIAAAQSHTTDTEMTARCMARLYRRHAQGTSA